MISREHYKAMRVAMAAFLVGCVGVGAGFAADYWSLKLLGEIAFLVVLGAVLTGGGAVVWAIFGMFKKRAPIDQDRD